MTKVKIKKLHDSIVTPTQATKGSAGWDLYSPEAFILDCNWVKTIPLGFCIQIPEGYYVSVVPRSSMGKKRIEIPNSPATIDSDYTGQVHLVLANNSDTSYVIGKGDRIGQMILHKYNEIEFEEVDEIEQTERGSGGFGSTGL